MHSTVPGDSSVPTSRNQSAPSASATVTCASVSTLSTSVGGASVSSSAPAISTCADRPESDVSSLARLDDLVDAAAVRRRDPRERVAAVDRLEQRGLLAEQVLGRSLDEIERARRPRGPTPASRRSRRAPARCCRVAVRFMPTITSLGADRERGDERAFEHAVRVAVEQRAVLERAGLAFGRVHDDASSARPSDAFAATVRHLTPVGKPAPPRPRMPAAVTSSIVARRPERAGRGEAACRRRRCEVRGERRDGFGVEDATDGRHGECSPVSVGPGVRKTASAGAPGLAVDDEVDALVVEADQAGDADALGQRIVVRPREIRRARCRRSRTDQ